MRHVETAVLATCSRSERLCPRRVDWRGISDVMEEEKMPVIILWAVPAIIAVGGGIYLVSHMH